VIGSGKDGLPIILGNVDTPTPAGSTSPSGTDTMNKERTTAASPTVPLEKTPAARLTTPAEKDTACQLEYSVSRYPGGVALFLAAQSI
jgi:hypothetical protein